MKLLFISVIIILTSLVSGQWPCPSREDIFPCVCIYNEASEDPQLELDCSVVHSEDQLRKSLNQLYSFSDFYILSIRIASNGLESVDSVLCETVGDLTFKYIDISGTNITYIEETAFDSSHKTLKSLVITWNQIESMSIQLSDFDNLENLELNNNYLSNISIESSSLETLFLDNNYLTEAYFDHVNKIVFLDLSNNLFSTVPDMLAFNDLENLNLENNLIDYVWEDSFKFGKEPFILMNLNLRSNKITNIEKNSFAGVYFEKDSSLDFSGNEITTLDKSNWQTLIEVSIDKDAIGVLDLTDNPLACGCDIEWLLSDEDLLQKIHSQTTCNDGTYLKSINEDILSDLCSND